MNGICHKIGGITTSVIILSTAFQDVTPETFAVATIAGALGSLIPDIDEPNSIVGKKVKLLSKGFKAIFGHRGIIHTPFMLILICIGLFFGLKKIPEEFLHLCTYSAIFFVIGYLSHLILDYMTPQGIMIFYPFSKKRFRIFGLKGKYRDLLVSTFCIITMLVVLGIKYEIITIHIENALALIVNIINIGKEKII